MRRVGLGIAVAKRRTALCVENAAIHQASAEAGAAREFCELIMFAQGERLT